MHLLFFISSFNLRAGPGLACLHSREVSRARSIRNRLIGHHRELAKYMMGIKQGCLYGIDMPEISWNIKYLSLGASQNDR